MTVDILNAAMIIIFAFWATTRVKDKELRLALVLVVIGVAAFGLRLVECIG